MNTRAHVIRWLIIFLLVPILARADDVKLAWDDDENDPSIVAGYRIYYGTSSGVYSEPIDAGRLKTGTVPNLIQGVQYYFAVTAYSVWGLESGYSSEVAYTVPDTTPPAAVFSVPVSSGSYVSAGNTIPIAGTASDNIGVTEVYWSCRGATGIASGTTSWSVPSVPLLPGVNVITVTAVDAAQNLGFASISVTYNPPSTVISKVARIELSSTSVEIRWLTSVPSDSTVEYGTSIPYSSSVSDPNPVYSHSVVLANLVPGAHYYYRVSSRDASGNLVASDGFEFTLGEAAQTLALPRLFTPGFGSGDEAVGVALANLDAGPDSLTFTAFDTGGDQVSGQGITNPAIRTLDPGAQLPVLDSQLFGFTSPKQFLSGWVMLETGGQRLSGFFLMFDGGLTKLDGALLTASPMHSVVLPEIQAEGFTKLNIANMDYGVGSLRIDLVKTDGTVRNSTTVAVPGRGSLVADAFADLFPGVTPDPSDYLRVSSPSSLAPYELTGAAGEDMAILGGLDATQGASVLYSPQYVVGGTWKSTLSIVNLDSVAGNVTLSFFDETGNQIGQSITSSIVGQGKLYIDSQNFFTPAGKDDVQGFVKIVSDGVRLAGSLRVNDEAGSVAALPLVSSLGKSLVFGHIASNDLYYTGIAIVNPGDVNANVSIDVYSDSGVLQNHKAVNLQPRQRTSGVLTQFFPELTGRDLTSGYIRVTSDQGVAGFALFGTNDSKVLSAIPAQIVP